MRRRTYLIRKGARYHFRRRLPFDYDCNRPITIALNTAEPAEARRLASRLAVRWDEVAMYAGYNFERSALTREEQRSLFRKALEDELLHATRDPLPMTGTGHPSTHKILAAAYDVVRLVSPGATSIHADDIDAVIGVSWTEEERRLLARTLSLMITPKIIGWGTAARELKELGVPVNNGTLHEARSTMLRGRAEAQKRACLSEHPLIAATGDPGFYLADDALVAEARKSDLPQAPAPTQPVSRTAPAHVLFSEATTVRFSEQLDDLEAAMFELNGWQPDNGKIRLMLETFAWLTGDKAMSDYRPADIPAYVRNLRNIPTDFLWGRLGKAGGMAMPFDPQKFAQKIPADRRRSARTINSHLTKMAAASEILKRSFWLPRAGFGNVMDFHDCRLKVDDDPASPKRVPWTPSHLRVMYGLPLWQGGGGANQRVKTSSAPVIYQDAAYWVPLLGTYTGLAR